MTARLFPPVFENLPGCQSDIFLPFLKICQDDKMGGKCPTVTLANFQKKGRKVSDSHHGKFSKMGGKCPTVILANFQKLFLKFCQDDSRTFSSHFWKSARMTVGHYPPVFENLQGWQSDIFLLFLKICQDDSQTLSSRFWKFARMTVGHFPPVFENCQFDSQTISSHFWKFARMTVRHFPPVFENLPGWQLDCPTGKFQKREENV